MTIALITALWPESEASPRDQGTFAVYELVRSWTASQNLVVFNLSRTPWFHRIWRSASPWQNFGACRVISTPLGREFPGGRSLVAPTTAWIRARLREQKLVPDVILTHFRSSHLMGQSLRKAFPGSIHVTGIHQFDLRRLASHSSFRQALDRADGIAFRSHAVREKALAFGAQWGEKSFLALSGVPENWLTPPRPGTKPESFVIGTVAKLISRKHVGTIIEALARIRDRAWVYHVVGDGPERSHWESLAATLGVADRVRFWGLRTHEEVKAHLDGWDIFAMPSSNETFGLAYLEAMARGCLVVGAAGWGIDGIVRHSENGFLVAPGDIEATVATFQELFGAPSAQWEAWRTSTRGTISQLTEPQVSSRYLSFLQQTHERQKHV